jgi:hypothetical protein
MPATSQVSSSSSTVAPPKYNGNQLENVYRHVSASYASARSHSARLPKISGLLEPRVVEHDRQLAAGRSMRSTVYTGKMSCCRFSARPSLPRTVKIVGRPAKGFPAGVVFGGGGGSRMGAQPSVFTVNPQDRGENRSIGKAVDFLNDITWLKDESLENSVHNYYLVSFKPAATATPSLDTLRVRCR